MKKELNNDFAIVASIEELKDIKDVHTQYFHITASVKGFSGKQLLKDRISRIRTQTIDEIVPTLVCKNVDTDMYYFMMPSVNTVGYYSDYFKKIYIRKDLIGASLVDTLYHEDRHHQQYTKDSKCFANYIREEDDRLGYMLQHVEKDARRYAYVQTIKALKRKGGLRRMLAAMLITHFTHPFKGRMSTNVYNYGGKK